MGTQDTWNITLTDNPVTEVVADKKKGNGGRRADLTFLKVRMDQVFVTSY